TGFSGERAQASTVPSAAGFCSSVLPSGIQSPCCVSIVDRSSRHRSWYRTSVLPTIATSAGGSEPSSRYAVNEYPPLGVVRTHGSSRVPLPFAELTAL